MGESVDIIDLTEDSEDEIEIIEQEKDDDIIECDSEDEERLIFSNCQQHKRLIMQRNTKRIDYDEWGDYQKVYAEIKKRIEDDPILKQHFDFTVLEKADDRVCQMQGIRLHQEIQSFIKKHETPDEVSVPKDVVMLKKAFKDLRNKARYTPPDRRNRIMKNLTLDPQNPIPLYCDMLTIDPKKVKISETMIFDYIDKNKITSDVDIGYEKLVKSEEILIRCDCKKIEGKFVNCFDNPNCPCFNMNQRFQEIQKINAYRQEHEKTQFKAFSKILMRDIDHYFDTIGFCCSSNCECEGCCDNNVIYTIEQKINRFEIYRHDEKGFCLRTRNFIPYGSPIFEFVGEFVDFESVSDRESEDYAFCCFDSAETVLRNFFQKLEFLSSKTRERFHKFFDKKWYVDPKFKGNEARFVSHGCQPNLGMCRVFQGGIGPQHLKCIMISLEDIFPGAQLTFDYGENYVIDQLKDNCLCLTPACTKNTFYKELTKASFEDMFHFFSLRYYYLARDYKSFVVNGRNLKNFEKVLSLYMSAPDHPALVEQRRKNRQSTSTCQ
ncbi:unnamed protein product [Caenorhabditis angaria]|uniref:SET domain-containing protein n=1 Tax=Caenorhabditis angaria TaxID=860376 RepID=A0A9P1II13_9PELO|nr:unnamed protein product [Caenorhabditis angaria]